MPNAQTIKLRTGGKKEVRRFDMDDTKNEDHEDACRNLGRLIFRLARPHVVIKIDVESSIINGEMVRMTVALIRDGKTQQMSEMLTAVQLAKVSDIDIIIDAMQEKLRRS